MKSFAVGSFLNDTWMTVCGLKSYTLVYSRFSMVKIYFCKTGTHTHTLIFSTLSFVIVVLLAWVAQTVTDIQKIMLIFAQRCGFIKLNHIYL